MSQNASTWTPNQNEDIMFELFKAKFDISSTGKCTLVNDDIPEENLGLNPIETQQGSGRVRIHLENHGMTENSKFYMRGFEDTTDYNGFLGSDLNGEHTVIDTEIDTFIINFDSIQASKTGMSGGENIYGVRNYQLDVSRPIVNELILDETDVKWKIKSTTGQSIDGAQTPFVSTGEIDIINNEDHIMEAPMLIASKYNEVEHLSGEKSLSMIGMLESNNENVSPVIDAVAIEKDTNDGDLKNMSTSTFIAIANKIDSPSIATKHINSDVVFSVGNGEDELIIHHENHEMGTGSYIYIENFNDTLPGIVNFDPNGLHKIRIIDKDNYFIDMGEQTTSGYSGSGDDSSGNHETIIKYSESHYIYVPENNSFNCSSSARYMTRQVNLNDPAENFKLMFSAVREQYTDIDIYYKVRSPYEITDWNDIDWIRLDSPDESVTVSESSTDFKEYTYTKEGLDPYNAISIKIVMKSTDSTQVPIFQDLRLICTT